MADVLERVPEKVFAALADPQRRALESVLLEAHRGEEAETRRACAEHLQLSQETGHGLLGLWVAATLALAEVSRGNFEAAWEACAPLVAALEQHGIGEPVTAFFLPDALDALIALGHLDRAETLIDTLEGCGHDLDRVWVLAVGARCRAQLLAARGELAGALAAAEGALAEHERIELPFERGRALLVKGMVERRLRRRAQGKASVDGVLALFEPMGAPRWAARARAELDGLGQRRAPAGGLTHAEQNVAQLTAQGLTRRDVAAALFVSPKTVDATLGRVYRKLGIRSRAELGAHKLKSVKK